MQRPSSRGTLVLGAVSAAAIVGVGEIMLSPAQAQQAATTIARIFAVVSCHSPSPCSGGVNGGSGFGVLAIASSNNGVDAATKNPSNTRAGRSGVYGHDDSTDGGTGNVGVAGSSPNGYGMWGSSTNGIGVQATSTNSTALQATSTNAIGLKAAGGTIGLIGMGNQGVVGDSLGIGAAVTGYVDGAGPALAGIQQAGVTTPLMNLYAGATTSSGTAIQVFDGNSTQMFRLDDGGNVKITGFLYTAGSCSVGCSKTHHVTEYAPRESVPTVEDIGEAQLASGKAFVSLDPAFANVIDRSANCVVFVSPEGPNQGLYVTHKTSRGFEVIENPGGHSSIPFGYRIVAKPYGATAPRLPMSIDAPAPEPYRLKGAH